MARVARPAAFLDRDGTLNVRPPPHRYLTTARDFVWLEGAREALVQLASSGFLLAVVSNQRGVASGATSIAALRGIEERIQRSLDPLGCRIETFRYCVHDLDAGCACRKPSPGMLLDVAAAFDVDLASSWMFGDTDADVAAGRAAGCRTALLANGTDATGLGGPTTRPDLRAPSLLEAVRLVTARGGTPPGRG